VTLQAENAVSYQNYYAAPTTYAVTHRWGPNDPHLSLSSAHADQQI